MTYQEYLEKKYNFKNGKINDYLSIKNNTLFYKDINLLDVAKKYQTPLEMIYPDMIDERINKVKKYFQDAIKKYNYQGNYIYAYSAKANYYEETISKILTKNCSLETTTEYDTKLALYLKKKRAIKNSQLIICNGFKLPGYIKIIDELTDLHPNVISVIENDRDLELINKLNKKILVGIRLKMDLEKSKEKIFEKTHNRFGYYKNEIHDTANKINQNKKLKLEMLHFMAGSQIEDTKQFEKVLNTALIEYCKLKKVYPSMKYFNIGGGLPTQYSFDFDFNYKNFIFELIKNIKKTCKEYKVKEPTIITEYGRYTVADYASTLFKVEYTKKIHEKKEKWYIVDGSIMTNLPDAWALDQSFLVLPLNGYERPIQRVRIAGITCDSDDIYHGRKKDGPLIMPQTQDEQLYIGFFGCGAYQANISGIGGVHHCMLPEPSEVIVRKINGKNNFHWITKKQSFEKVLKILDYT